MTTPIGPYSDISSLPPPEVTRIHSSRRVDFETGDYVLDEYGNSEKMDDTAQRVVCLVMSECRHGRFVTDRDMEAWRQRVRNLLEILEDEGVIRIDEITIEEHCTGKVRQFVEVLNLGEGRTMSFERFHG